MKPIPSSRARATITPIGDRILLEYVATNDTSRGGIIIPDQAQEKSQRAKVIALGTGRRGPQGEVTPFDVKVGDTVLVAKYGGAEVKVDERKYTLVREDDILGVLV